MSDYKFKVGDRVRVLKIDDWSVSGMEYDIGEIGTIIDYDNDDGVNSYLIKISKFQYWYMENSLELVSEELISKDDVLNILYEIKENDIFNYEAMYDFVRRVRELPCK